MHVGGVTVLAPGLGTGLKRGKFYLRYFTVLIFLKEREIQAGGGCVTETGAQRGRGSVLAKDPPWRLRVEVTSLFGEFWAEMRLCIALGNFQGYSSLFLS